jgi:hypothetical protein
MCYFAEDIRIFGITVDMIMTQQQWETVEKSLAGLTTQDKLEVVERLAHELRSEPRELSSRIRVLTEAEFKQQLLKTGLMTSLPTPADPATRPAFEPIVIEGEPLSETIIRERR